MNLKYYLKSLSLSQICPTVLWVSTLKQNNTDSCHDGWYSKFAMILSVAVKLFFLSLKQSELNQHTNNRDHCVSGDVPNTRCNILKYSGGSSSYVTGNKTALKSSAFQGAGFII